MHSQCTDRFHDGIHQNDSVFFPGLGPGLVAMPAPQIDDFLAVLVDTDTSSDLVPAGKILAECLLDRGECGVASPTDRNVVTVHN
jgi:hypothetical protein